MQSEKWGKIKNSLKKAARKKDPAMRGVEIASVVASALHQINIDPVLVGGAVVSFYTEGKYTTQDIDMVSPSGSEVSEIMQKIGFKKIGKDFINKELGIYVEFPSESLGPTEKVDVVKVGGTRLKMISLEDIIVDRLSAYKYWGSTIDGVNAMIMLETANPERKRLEKRASEEDVLDALDYIEDLLERVIRKKISRDDATDLLNRFK